MVKNKSDNQVNNNSNDIFEKIRPNIWRHYFGKIVFIVLIISGLIGLWESINAVFFIYPNISQFFTSKSYIELLQRAFIISTTGFFESSYGLAMSLKPSNLIKKSHIVIGIGLFFFSLIIKTKWQIISPGLLVDVLNSLFIEKI